MSLMLVLYIHIANTVTAMVLGYYLFAFSQKPIQKQPILVGILSTTLIIASITGIFLNTRAFSQFHVLSIVVLTTLPFALFDWYRDRTLQFKKNLFYNFLGLNAAFVGTLSPTRLLGSRLWNPIRSSFGLDLNTSRNIYFFALAVSILIIIWFVIKANRPKFFR